MIDMSIYFRDMLEEKEDIYSEEIELPSINSEYLKLVIDYCEHFEYKKDSFIE